MCLVMSNVDSTPRGGGQSVNHNLFNSTAQQAAPRLTAAAGGKGASSGLHSSFLPTNTQRSLSRPPSPPRIRGLGSYDLARILGGTGCCLYWSGCCAAVCVAAAMLLAVQRKVAVFVVLLMYAKQKATVFSLCRQVSLLCKPITLR